MATRFHAMYDDTAPAGWLKVLMVSTVGFAGSALADADRAVRVEATVNGPVSSVWDVWTTSAGAQTFFAPKTNIELRIGGPYEVFFNPADERMSTRGRKVLSYAPKEMLSFEWNLPLDLYPQLREERTWVVVDLRQIDASHTHVTITQLGFKDGPAWDGAAQHMQRGWVEAVQRLKARFDTGPIQWPSQPMMCQERAK